MWSFSNMNIYEVATIIVFVLSSVVTLAMGRYIAKSDAKDRCSYRINPAPMFYIPLVIGSVACIGLFGLPAINFYF